MVNEALSPNGALSNRLAIFQRAHLIAKMSRVRARSARLEHPHVCESLARRE